MTLLRQKQNGVALVVSLIMLLIMSLLAVSSMNTTVLEEKMAGNFKDRNMAFQAAEAALRAGENYLANTAVLPIFDGSTTGLYQPTASGLPRWDTVDWDAIGEVINYTDNLADIAEAPKYIIEELEALNESPVSGEQLEVQYYRITSLAVGGTDTAVVMLQSTYKR